MADGREGEVARAYPEARRRAVWLFFALLVLGLACILVTLDRLGEIETLAERDLEAARQQVETALGLISLVNAAALLLVAGYFGSLSVRIFRSGRFPPPRVWLIRDTRIVRGARARWAGVVTAVLAALFLALAILPLLLWQGFVTGFLEIGGV